MLGVAPAAGWAGEGQIGTVGRLEPPGRDFLLAIRFGDEATVRDLVESAPRPLLPRDALGPPIRLAAEFGRVEIVRVLLEAARTRPTALPPPPDTATSMPFDS